MVFFFNRYASQSVLYKKQQNYYEILGVTKQASSKDLKVAYYKKCKVCK
jgi:preprotein translocase subunit Sec63